MSQNPNQTRQRDPLEHLSREQEFDMAGVRPGMAIMPQQQGDVAVNIFGGTITAQRVAVKRDIVKIKHNLEVLAATFGCDNWIYRWQVNNRSTGGKDTIEGGTIKLANDIAREWGNCQVDIRVIDEGAHWMFYGRFVDLETGYSLTRPYQQRKSQKMGMKDEQRSLDMIMQIGTSKCIRNVVLNALQALTEACLEMADNSVQERVKKAPDKANKWILDELAKLGVDVKRVERVVTRTAKNWTVPDMAGLFTQIRSVTDGMVLPDDLWPTDETLKQREAEGNYDATKNQQAPKKEGGDTPPAGAGEDTTKGGGEPDPAAAEKNGPTEQQQGGAGSPTEFIVKNESGVAVGKLAEKPELGSEFDLMGVKVRAIEVNDDPPLVVVKVVAPPPKPSSAKDKANAAANKATSKGQTTAPAAPPAQQQGGGDALFND